MEVQSVMNSYAVSQGGTPVATSTAGNALDSEQFMQILLTQLTHQNPLEPMDNAEMTTQFSQLNSLQELRSIRTEMETVAAFNQTAYLAGLIGKTVKAARSDGKIVEGVVDGVIVETDHPQLRMGKETIDLVDILEIKEG